MRAGKRDYSEGYISHCYDYTIQNILHNSKKYSFAKAYFCDIPNTSIKTGYNENIGKKLGFTSLHPYNPNNLLIFN